MAATRVGMFHAAVSSVSVSKKAAPMRPARIGMVQIPIHRSMLIP